MLGYKMLSLNMQVRWYFIGVLLLFGAHSVNADFIFEFDMDLDQPGVQSTRQVASGESVFVDLRLRINGVSSLSAYSLGMIFDSGQIQVTGVTTPSRPLGFSQVGAINVDNVNGIVRPFAALNFNTDNDLGAGYSGIVARMNLVAHFSNVNQTAELKPLFQNILDGVLTSDNLMALPGNTPGDGGVFFNGGSLSGVTAVPEPTSLLLVSTATGMMLIRRRWRQLLANTKPSKN
jgi:hypothetical protein